MLGITQSKFPVFWQNSVFFMCFGKISKLPVFPDTVTVIFFCHFPCFPCAVGTLNCMAAHRPAPNNKKQRSIQKPQTICMTYLTPCCFYIIFFSFFKIFFIYIYFFGQPRLVYTQFLDDIFSVTLGACFRPGLQVVCWPRSTPHKHWVK